MTTRTRRYITRNKYCHWWRSRPILGYDITKIEQNVTDLGYTMVIKLAPNFYNRTTKHGEFTVTKLS